MDYVLQLGVYKVAEKFLSRSREKLIVECIVFGGHIEFKQQDIRSVMSHETLLYLLQNSLFINNTKKSILYQW